LGRIINPLAHKFSAWSPYTYAINSPIACADDEGENPRITTQMVNGVMQITVHQRVYLVMDNMKNVSEAMSLVGNPIPYFTANSTGISVLDANGNNIPVTFNFVYEVGIYEKKNAREAKSDYSTNGFGVIVNWYNNKKGTPTWMSGKQDKIAMYSQGTRTSINYAGEFAHELTHDWAGLNDMYIYLEIDGDKRKGMVVADPNAPYNLIQPLQDLMNDANSPLSQNSMAQVAQGIYDMYGANGGGVNQPLNANNLDATQDGAPVSVTVEGSAFLYDNTTNTYQLSGYPYRQISGNILYQNGLKALNPNGWRIRTHDNGWRNQKQTKHKIKVPQAKF